jgi:hypothetical protein
MSSLIEGPIVEETYIVRQKRPLAPEGRLRSIVSCKALRLTNKSSGGKDAFQT